MRTAKTVFVAGSLLVFASCSSSSNDQGDGGYNGNGAANGTGANSNGASSNGASSNGASSNGASSNGATGNGANTGVGGSGNSDCALGNSCSTNNSTCNNGNIVCTCANGSWSSCHLQGTGTGGAPGAGGSGTGANSPTSGSSTGATGANGGGSNGDGGSGGAGGASCITVDSAAKASPQVLLFAIDATGSMNDAPASAGGLSKWNALKAVWPELVDNLPTTWAVGMMEWSCPGCGKNPAVPYQPSMAVPIAPLSDAAQIDALKNGLTADPLGGFTPTECAYNYALDQVQSWAPPPEFDGAPRFIVLLTDGVPTVTSDCVTLGAIKAGQIPVNETQYEHLIGTVAAGTTSTGIQTFVGGVPGSDEPQGANYDPMYMLSLLAAAGGTAAPSCAPTAGTVQCPDGTTPALNALGIAFCDQHGGNPQLVTRGTYCHFDMTQGNMADDLRATLKKIKATAVKCAYDVPPTPPTYAFIDASSVKVIYLQNGTTPVELTAATNNDCAQGGDWYYSEQDPNTGIPTKLEICPDKCTEVQLDLDASIDIRFECLKEV
jgi:hypothetical protein